MTFPTRQKLIEAMARAMEKDSNDNIGYTYESNAKAALDAMLAEIPEGKLCWEMSAMRRQTQQTMPVCCDSGKDVNKPKLEL